MTLERLLVAALYASLVAELISVAVPSSVSARRKLAAARRAAPGNAVPTHRIRLRLLVSDGLPLLLSITAFLFPLIAALFPALIPDRPPYWTTTLSPWSPLGLLLMGAGRILTWRAMAQLRVRGAGLEGPLVTDGLFARSRHPGLVGMFLFAAGGWILYPGWILGLAFLLYGLHMDRKARDEERTLLAAHPEDFARYAAAVPRYVGARNRLEPEDRRRIGGWFDRTYATKGLRYLRPLAAYRHFPTLLGLEGRHRYLDIGCGPGLLLEAAAPSGAQRFGLDLSRVALRLAQERGVDARLVCGSALALPFPDAHFDRLSCIGTIERFPDRPRALAEMLRVARPDARFCFMVRNARTLGWRVLKQALGRRSLEGHEDALGLEEWRALFLTAGFETLEVHGDPWPRARLHRAARRLFAQDPDRVTLSTRPLLPLRFANEFIFVLKRAAPSSGA